MSKCCSVTDAICSSAAVPEVGEPDALQHGDPRLVVAEEPSSVVRRVLHSIILLSTGDLT